MAVQTKLTAKYGATDRGDVAIVAGDAEAQSDTISINIDATKMGKAEAIHLLEKMVAAFHAAPWPPVA